MFGYTQEELFQKTFQDLTLPEDRPESTKVSVNFYLEK